MNTFKKSLYDSTVSRFQIHPKDRVVRERREPVRPFRTGRNTDYTVYTDIDESGVC